VHHLSKDGTITGHYFSAVVSEHAKGEVTEIAMENKQPHPTAPAYYNRTIHLAYQQHPHLSTNTSHTNHRPFENYSMQSYPPFNQQLKFILHSANDSDSENNGQISNPLGILVGSILPHSPYQIERIAGSFHSHAITPFDSYRKMKDLALSCPDFITQVKTTFRKIDNILSLLNSTKLDIISIEFSIIHLEKYSHTFSRELSNYMQTENFSSSITGVSCLIPHQSKIQAKMIVLVRNAILSNFSIQKF
jgi:hypothetical protein